MQQRSLSLGSPLDPVLHRIGPLAAAIAAGTCLVIDLDPHAAPLPGAETLADLCSDGLHSRHLMPDRAGVAVIPNGGVGAESATDVVAALRASWPAVVFRTPSPHVPIVPLLPGLPARSRRRPCVYQPAARSVRAPGPGILLPPLSRSAATSLLRGSAPARLRWVRAWSQVWAAPWD